MQRLYVGVSRSSTRTRSDQGDEQEGVKLGDAEIKQDELGRWFIIQPIMRNAQEHPVECIPNHENLSLKFTSIQESGQVSQGTVQKVAFKMGDDCSSLSETS
jgi:hypothetical protein